MQISVVQSFGQIAETQWQSLAKKQSVFVQYPFLLALEQSAAVGPQSGWQPHHLVGYQDGELVCAMPAYIKSNSYGEYVFDFAWADAYQRQSMAYYPKLVSAIPFTPVTGARLLCDENFDIVEAQHEMVEFVKSHLSASALSSFHLLFCDNLTSDTLHSSALSQRLSVQFVWNNSGYASFDDFIQRFTARRRKSIKKERAKIAAQGIEIKRLCSTQIAKQDLAVFYQCYCQTYLKRSGHTGYLNHTFFQMLLASMPQNLMLVMAYRQNTPIASALFLFNDQQLCGRYWGALEQADSLHFECCYYQGIEFCIERQIDSFNPGTQGEHKILRGFEPTLCYSNHYLKDPRFQSAVADFLQREAPQIQGYLQQANTLLPYKKT